MATFVYSVLALGSIGQGAHGDFVPHISITVTLVLMVADLAVLIYFLHHIAVMIRQLDALAKIMERADAPDDYQVLLDQAAMIERLSTASVDEESDRADVRRAYQRVLDVHAGLAAAPDAPAARATSGAGRGGTRPVRRCRAAVRRRGAAAGSRR